MNALFADVLIIGAGLSGLYTALNIDIDKQIILLAKEPLGISNTSLAQGGIAGEMQEDETKILKHMEDTFVAGAGLFDPDAIWNLVHAAKENITTLIELGVRFDVDEEGRLLLTQEGGHSSKRILHAGGDATGKELMLALLAHTIKRKNIKILEEAMFIDFLTSENRCYGASAIKKEGEIIQIFAADTIVATGGIGEVFKDSTNSKGATGDGIAAAYRANVMIRGMEFVQFHPTAFYDTKQMTKGQKFLISEAVRGEGAILLNIENERFMPKYDLRAELAPRDIVAQAIHRELYDTWSEYVLLDARHLGKDYLIKRFPTIYQKCFENGYQMNLDLIPVAPVEHYGIGGIAIDQDGRTSMDHLFANGECSNSGVHGANRLASNSLLECVVYGKRISQTINKSQQKPEQIKIQQIELEQKPYLYHSIRLEVRSVMDQYVGVIRTKTGLALAKTVIEKHYNNLKKHPQVTIDYFRTLNIVSVAMLIIKAAIKRKQSIGCHYRID